MLERLGGVLSRASQRLVPDPFVLALLLTLVSMGAAFHYTGFDAQRTLDAWMNGSGGGKGFWNLLAFGMQMCLILVTGHALAASPPLRRLLDALASRAKSPASAIVIVSVAAMALALVNWGLGLIAGALLARAVGQRAKARGIVVHYPLLAAAGYSGLLVWHGGLSGSAPLKVTLATDLTEILGADLAARVGTLPLSETILAWPNLAANGVLLVVIPWILVRMLPRNEAERAACPVDAEAQAEQAEQTDGGLAARLDGSRALALGAAGLGAVAFWLAVKRQGIASLDPNLINFAFLFLGLALHGSPRAYAEAIGEAAKGCAGILLQFPFYAGIMGLLTGTGLLKAIAAALAGVGATALPAVSFYAAGLVNLFVPSGGGQWAVQGPVLMQAAVDTGIEPSRLLMALAYGDQWTNMLQPFWALPLLGITGVKARDIIGYTTVLLLVSQVAFVTALYL
ncbi:MAG: TIGR00366 family protein [Polyangiaceae bacterium]